MPRKGSLTTLCTTVAISWLDLAILGLLLFGGLLYHHDALHWGIGWIGEAQYGDAEFWWNGAVHIAQGIFQDNPGKGFRPGYFVLTGLTLPILGMQFQQYYPYFIMAFLAVVALFYLSLRLTLGRAVAVCVVSMLVFNPFIAEWLATSTTDGMGLVLNLAALACLLLGVNKGLHRKWLVIFGILFALATLTRPLVTPFMGIVLLALLILPQASYQKRVMTVLCVLAAFCLPTLVWMTAQKLTIDRWAISSNDASAFYAASDPDIQVWKPSMYDHIQQLSAEHYHIAPAKVDDKMLNSMFWEETVKNYIRYPQYHILRLAPHIWQIAKFSPKMATHGTDKWRKVILSALAIGYSLWFLLQRYWLRGAMLLLAALSISLSSYAITCLTLLGALVALMTPRRDQNLGVFLLSLYWLTGVAALYFVGGTWGPPSFSSLFSLNALGYRLGSQVFFAGDLLAAYFIAYLAYFNLTATKPYPKGKSFIYQPAPLAGAIVLASFSLFFVATLTVYVMGSVVVVQRSYARLYAPVQPYPALAAVKVWFQQQHGKVPVQVTSVQGGLDEYALTKMGTPTGGGDLIFTGTISPFIWNMQGQQRAQLMIHTQKQVSPFTMGPGFVILEVPQHLLVQDWAGVQGAFIIRQLPNKHNESNVAYYLTTPAVRAFIPLTADRKGFAIHKAVWFPLMKNATQLETSGELHSPHAKITWAQDSGHQPYQRRFFVFPQNSTVQLILDLTKARGAKTLSFAYLGASAPGTTSSPKGYYDVNISTLSKDKAHQGKRLLAARELYTLKEDNAPLKNVKLSIPANTKAIEVTFNKLLPDTGIWIYEFNLSADDFVN